MFQQTFVPEAHSGRKPIGIAVSVIVQSLVVALLSFIPLLIRQPVPTAQLRLLFLGPTPPIAPEKPIVRSGTTAQTSFVRVRSFRLTAPIQIPKQINRSVEGAPEAPDIAEAPGSNAAGESLLSGLGAGSNSVPPPMPKERPQIKEQTGPLAIGGTVAAANLVRRVEPTYPPLAKAARIQGVVVFQAIIGTDGQIRNLQLQEGHPLLVTAARDAILQWRYRPTLLNGRPVDVVTTITVHFSLSQ